jgi:hypothetical protein
MPAVLFGASQVALLKGESVEARSGAVMNTDTERRFAMLRARQPPRLRADLKAGCPLSEKGDDVGGGSGGGAGVLLSNRIGHIYTWKIHSPSNTSGCSA